MTRLINARIARDMAMYQIRKYINTKAAGAKLSAADILDHLYALKMSLQPCDKLQILISALEQADNKRYRHQYVYARLMRTAIRQNPHFPDIKITLHQILLDIFRNSEFVNGYFQVSRRLNNLPFR